MSFRQITAVALLALASITSAAELPPQGVQVPAEPPALGPDTVAGCFSSLGDMKLETSYQFNSQSYCATQCRKKGKLMGASQAKNCFCGDKIPFHGTLLNDTQCNQPCPGFGEQACMLEEPSHQSYADVIMLTALRRWSKSLHRIQYWYSN